jgi:glucose/arabinose dehydrogenase
LLLSAIGAVVVGLGRWGRRLRALAFRAITAVAVAVVVAQASPVARAAGPQVVASYQQSFTLRAVGTVPGSPTQMTFGPSGRIYMMTTDSGVISFAYDPATGSLSSPVNAAPGIRGIGIAFHGRTMYLSSFDGTIHKLEDANNNGIWGEAGELDVAIVTGLPQGDHNTDQIQILGNTLYVGIGRRTINGHLGAYTSGQLDDLGGRGFFFGGTGRTYGDSAYNGTIAWIRDLTAVANQLGSANAWTTEPPILSQALIQHDAGPFSGGGPGSLVVHSAGTRNPFGLCLDNAGNLWFTNNFNRTTTLGNGQAGFGLRGDQLDSDFSRDVQDQLFRASPGADYGYTDVNWRGVNPMLTPSAPGYHRVTSTTFDNSFNKGPYTIHDPANPDGLGPSASADGCAFSNSAILPAELRGNVFIARYNGTITEAPGGLKRSMTFSDLVAVDVSVGKVRQIASGFNSPLAVLADDTAGRILVADYGDKIVYALQAVVH